MHPMHNVFNDERASFHSYFFHIFKDLDEGYKKSTSIDQFKISILGLILMFKVTNQGVSLHTLELSLDESF